MDAKELKSEIESAKFLRDYWQEKARESDRNIARMEAKIESLAAELSQVSA